MELRPGKFLCFWGMFWLRGMVAHVINLGGCDLCDLVWHVGEGMLISFCILVSLVFFGGCAYLFLC